jgi:aminopeptidase
MADLRVEKLAEVLVSYSTKVQKGDTVLIQGDAQAEPLIKAVYAKVLQAGGHPMTLVSLPGVQELFFNLASKDQLQYIHTPQKLIMETYDVRISIRAASNTKALSSVDPAKIALASQASRELMKVFMERSATDDLRWVAANFPTAAYAQDAEMSLNEYEDFVYGACLPDIDDPVGYWQRFSIWQQKIVDWLKGKECVHVIGPDTDLHLNIAGRTFINSDGTKNMPSGEVYTGPVEESVEGHVYFSYPAIYQGREVVGVRLEFEKGKVMRATADKNEDFLLQMLDTDEGARYVGEFAIGTNKGINRFTRQILFDEKINGSFHMAMGAGYPETGSTNESAIHWDMICDLRQGGEIWVDDVLLYQNGRFMITF